MDGREMNILNNLKKKYDAVSELLRVTKLVTLTGDSDKFEREAEDYAYMIESREMIFKEIRGTDQKLTSGGYRKLKETAGYTFPVEIQTVEKSLQTMIEQLIELDRINNDKARLISARLKNAIKGVNQGKNMNAIYQRHVLTGGGYFDSKH
jgi:hypothetical protein